MISGRLNVAVGLELRCWAFSVIVTLPLNNQCNIDSIHIFDYMKKENFWQILFSQRTYNQRSPVLLSRNRNTETLGSILVSESESVSKSRLERSRNRSWNQNSDIPSLRIGTGIESQTFQVSELEPESKFSVSRIFPLIATAVLV